MALAVLLMAPSGCSKPNRTPSVDTSAAQRRLEDPKADIGVRMEAVRSLVGVASAEGTVIRVLQNPREPLQLRIVALRTLAPIPTVAVRQLGYSDNAVSAVASMIDDRDPILRLEAIRGLGHVAWSGQDAAVGPLRRAFKLGDDAAWEAAFALGRLGRRGKDAIPDFRAAVFGPKTPPEVWNVLVQMGPSAVPLLVEAVESGPPRRAPAIAALGSLRFGAKAALPSLRALAGTDRSALEAAREIGRTLEELAAGLKDPSVGVRRRTLSEIALAVQALDEDAGEIVPALRAALADADSQVRGEVPAILAGIGEPAALALPDMVGLLHHDAEVRVRCKAALAIGPLAFALRGRRPDLIAAARSALQNALDDPDAKVRECAEQSLLWVSS